MFATQCVFPFFNLGSFFLNKASLVAQMLKNLPAMHETWVRSLGWEDPREKEMATHSSILAWRIPGTEDPGGLLSMGLHRVGYNWSDLAAAEHDHVHQSKTQFFPQPAPPIRNLPQASYPHPSEDRQNENHNHRKLTQLITWITALSNSIKLWAMLCRAAQVTRSWWRVLTKCGPLEKRIANHFSILALRIPWTVWKGKIYMTLKDELPRSIGVQYATWEEQRNSSRKNQKSLHQSGNNAQLWMCLVVKVVSDAAKNNIA